MLISDGDGEDVPEEIDEPISLRRALEMSLTGAHFSPPKVNPLTLHSTLKRQLYSGTERVKTLLLSRDEVGEVLARCDNRLGVDYMALRFDTGNVLNHEVDLWQESRLRGAQVFQRTLSFPLEKGGVYLSVTRRGNASWGYANFNPSTILYGKKSTRIVTLEQSLEMFHTVMDEIAQIVEVRTPRMEVRLARLDLTVDVPNVADLQGVMAVAALSPYRRGLKPVTYTGPRGTESVTCITKKTGGLRGYDKSLQSGKRGQTLRVEVQVNSGKLVKYCPTIGDLTPVACTSLFRFFSGRFQEALLSTPRTTIDDLLATKAINKTFIEAVGISYLRDRGYSPQMSDHWWTRRYRDLKKAHPHLQIGDFFA